MKNNAEHTVSETDAAEKKSRASTAASEAVSLEKKPITRDISILLVLSFLAAAWFWFGHDIDHGAGIGLTISHWVLTAAVLILVKARKGLKSSREGFFMLGLSLLLSAVYGVYDNHVMKWLNLPVLLLISAQTLFTLTGHNRFSPLSGQGLWEGFRRYLDSLFRCWALPVRVLVLRERGKEGQQKIKQAIIGLIIAAFAAVLALDILSSADEMFAGMMNSAARQIGQIDGAFMIRLVLTVLLGLLLFSHRASLFQSPAAVSPVNVPGKNHIIFRMVLAALSAVYSVFSYVQIRYLFAGEESVQMSGGYAAYARSGFFQLVLVALLTLCLIMPALILYKKDKCVRILSAVVAMLTVIIDISAFFRMYLYIGTYGLTTLRIVTLWGIGMILLVLTASIAKSAIPELKVCSALTAIALSTWIGLNFANIDRVVAENQVNRFNAEVRQGKWQSPNDTGYADRIAALASDRYWSPDYYASFRKIEDPQARADALTLLEKRVGEKRPPLQDSGRRTASPEHRKVVLYDWNLSWLKIP